MHILVATAPRREISFQTAFPVGLNAEIRKNPAGHDHVPHLQLFRDMKSVSVRSERLNEVDDLAAHFRI